MMPMSGMCAVPVIVASTMCLVIPVALGLVPIVAARRVVAFVSTMALFISRVLVPMPVPLIRSVAFTTTMRVISTKTRVASRVAHAC